MRPRMLPEPMPLSLATVATIAVLFARRYRRGKVGRGDRWIDIVRGERSPADENIDLIALTPELHRVFTDKDSREGRAD